MSTTIKVLSFLVISCAFACLTAARLEPTCSTFDYEEKLLTKTMRLESRIEETDDRLAAIEKIGERLSDIKFGLEELQRDKANKTNNAKYRYVKYSSALLLHYVL